MGQKKNEWSLFAPWRSILAPTEGELGTNPQALDVPSPYLEDEPLAVIRSFAFVDLSGFTAFCDLHGEQRAIEVLAFFRGVVRSVAARRGVRVAKWLGDGVMLVGLDEAALAATVGEIVVRCEPQGLRTHAGLATGAVLLFEGDDYVGRPVNLAARLCDRAEPGQIIAAGEAPSTPEWLLVRDPERIEVPGVNALVDIHQLHVDPEIEDRFTGAQVA